jgi:thiamine biosynthesis lipoprotein
MCAVGNLYRFFASTTWRKIQINGSAQGTTYHITWYATDSTIGQPQIDSILQKIDTSLSIYNPQSLISKFNESASFVNYGCAPAHCDQKINGNLRADRRHF